MSTPIQITQRDVAFALGVHPSTICLALKNAPSIPLATRRRVQAAAEELGYRPNAAARNLALLRSEKQGGGCLPIAWINQEPQRNHWRTNSEARTVFESAQARAAELGYRLEEIWAREPGMTGGRLAGIVNARGLEGVIFPVHRCFDYSLMGPAWASFALVGLNDQRLSEWVDTVCTDHYRNADTAFRQASRFGLSRVGLVLSAQLNAASNGLVHSCFLRHQSETSRGNRIPLCFLSEGSSSDFGVFERWFESHRPEVVVTGDADLVARARGLGMDTLWFGLGHSAFPFDAGIDDAPGAAAAAAVDCVVDKMRRFEKGVSGETRMHLLRSPWTASGNLQLSLEREVVVA